MSSTHSARCGTRSLIHLPALAVLLPAPGAGQARAGKALKQLDLFARIERLAVALDQLGLVVERVALAGGAGHEQLDDPLGLGPMMQAAVQIGAPGPRPGIGQQSAFAQQRGQRDAAQSAAEIPEKLAPAARRSHAIRHGRSADVQVWANRRGMNRQP